MSTANAVNRIRAALTATVDSDFTASSRQLLAALGYRSDRVPAVQPASVQDFIASYPAPNLGTDSEQRFADNAHSVKILMQFTDAEIASSEQLTLFDAESFNKGNARSFLFVAVELGADTYPRGRYVEFTREINKRLAMPAVALFRTADGQVTLAFVHRRPNKRHPQQDVLGSVSLIREIDAISPHRAHLDILAELALPERMSWMDSHGRAHNFDGLLEAWLDALDTEELNRRFYRDLFGWFQRAVSEVKLPDAVTKDVSREEHVIRLITRLLFVWFIKEKGLVADDLFIENRVRRLLQKYDAGGGDSYYRAVLQNLFFATLNTEIAERRFSQQNNDDHRNFSVYRYQDEMADTGALLDLFAQTPFINGGLFDCLDSFDATRAGGVRIDCFTDNARHRRGYSIPNRLFFDDLGLITLFTRYKFTVEENTPAEREVALDPELLGKVFENLLAAFNPETRENARKQTGSYYTPRAVVDYMVDEALVAALAQKVTPANGDANSWEERLRDLLDYDLADAETLFDDSEREAIVRAIADTKVLDPAVGSGAFPTGVLHKLTLALRRLDPKNELWAELQREQARQRAASAFDTDDQAARDAELEEISDTFQRYRESDFGRKLYLIQNGIYGVDIQPIATQIAKLRFFISLAIDQEPTGDVDDNYGIKPLPNLETRFVAADSLLGIAQPAQPTLTQANNIAELHEEIRANRERHFHAKTRQQKQGYRNEDKRLRGELASALREVGFAADSAKQIADWDPYDQNASAGWFDAEYMFGVADGFDVVITNPPYIHIRRLDLERRQTYGGAGFITFSRMGDIYQLFLEKGSQLAKINLGVLSYITSNSWLKGEYGKSTRGYLADDHAILRLVDMGKDVFENTVVDSSVLIFVKGQRETPSKTIDMDRISAREFPPDETLWNNITLNGNDPWSLLGSVEQPIMDKVLGAGIPLKKWNVAIHVGIVTGFNQAFIVDGDTKEALIKDEPSVREIIKPVLRGRDIGRFRARWAGLWVIDMHNGYGDVPRVDVAHYPSLQRHFDEFYPQLVARRDQGSTPYNLRDCAFHEDYTKEKLVWIDLSDSGRFAYDESSKFCLNTTFFMTGEALKFLCAVLNSRVATWFVRNTALNSGMGTPRWIRGSVERIPVPKLSPAEQHPFIHLVDQILEAKAVGPNADTAELEAEIDRLVYALYGLTEEEIAAVEGR